MDGLEKYIVSKPSFGLIQQNIKNGRLFHAIMLVSEDEEYMSSYANCVARLLFCSEKSDIFCDQCNSCIKVKKGVHPDFITYGQDKSISSEEIKEMLDSVYVSGYEGDKKVYVLNNIESSSPVVANKLLKTLEEPPKDVYIILLVKNENAVLQTIKSRVQKYYLEGLTVQELAGHLRATNTPDADLVSALTCGNLSRIKGLAGKTSPKAMFDFTIDLMTNYSLTTQFGDYSKKFEKTDAPLLTKLDFIITILGDALRTRLNKPNLVSIQSEMDSLKMVASRWSPLQLSLVLDACLDARRKAIVGISNQAIIDQLLLKILEVKIKCKK